MVAATCTATGLTEGSHCSRCEAVLEEQETIPALGHDYGAYVQTKAPTCTAKGTETATCSRCSATTSRDIAALGHSPVTDKAVAATCTATGLTAGSHCSRCDTVLEEQQTVPALGHDYGDYVQTKAPTCTAKGTETATCSRCSNTTSRDIAALGHSPVTDKVVAATCTATGLTEGSHCSRCEAVLEEQETIPALGHDYGAYVQTKAPTCTAKGTETATCSRCSATTSRDIAALGHSPVTDKAVAATCTATGLTEGSHCSRCEAVLEEQETIPALGHDYGAYVQTKAPTCTAKGTETATCSRCAATTSRNILALGHNAVTDNAVAATCTMTGLTEGSHCSRCDTVLAAQEIVSALGHNYGSYVQIKAPTCTVEGTETATCSRCSATTSRDISALGHEAVTDEAVPASCTETGLTEGSHCSRCNEILLAQGAVPALGHEAVTDEAVAATCTTTGFTEGSHCSRCNTVLEAQEIVPALGHSWSDWEDSRTSCDEVGTRTRSCSVCGEEEIEELSAGTHTWDNGTVTKQPDCTQPGTMQFTCTVCGDTSTEDIEPLGHTEVSVEGVPATCTEEGLTSGSKCSVCGTVLTERLPVPPLGHELIHTEAVEPTEDSDGNIEYWQCDRCGKCFSDKDGDIEIDISEVAVTHSGGRSLWQVILAVVAGAILFVVIAAIISRAVRHKKS